MSDLRASVLQEYRKKLAEHAEIDTKLKEARLGLQALDKQYDKSENDIKALQSVGQIIGEVLKMLDLDKCIFKFIISSYCKSFKWTKICCWL